MKTQTKTTIDLTPSQARQLQVTGICDYIEPMDTHPKIELEEITANIQFKYKKVQKITIRQEWTNVSSNHYVNSRCTKMKSETMPEHLYTQAIIGNVDVGRVQKINPGIIGITAYRGGIGGQVIGWEPTPRSAQEQFKVWFNSNFSQPQPIECLGCNGKGYADLVDRQPMCEFCNGDEIESWICYIYDVASFPLLITHRDEYHENEKYESMWLGKPLSVIVDPYCYIVKIKIDSEENKWN